MALAKVHRLWAKLNTSHFVRRLLEIPTR